MPLHQSPHWQLNLETFVADLTVSILPLHPTFLENFLYFVLYSNAEQCQLSLLGKAKWIWHEHHLFSLYYSSSHLQNIQCSFCFFWKSRRALPQNLTQPRRPFKTGTFLNPLYTLPLQISWPPASTYFPLPVFSVCLNPLPPNTPTPSEAWVHCSDVLKVESAITVVMWELPGTGRLSRGLHHKAFWSCQKGLNTVFTAVTHTHIYRHTHTQSHCHSIICICVCMCVSGSRLISY